MDCWHYRNLHPYKVLWEFIVFTDWMTRMESLLKTWPLCRNIQYSIFNIQVIFKLRPLTTQPTWWAACCWWDPSSGDRWQPERWPCYYKDLPAIPGSGWQNPLQKKAARTISRRTFITPRLQTGGGVTYLIVSFQEFMKDHFINGRPETQISSWQILTDGLKHDRSGTTYSIRDTTFHRASVALHCNVITTLVMPSKHSR